jgi:HSP20 family protein
LKNLVKRNTFSPLVKNQFLPSVDAFFDAFGSRDLMDWTNQSLTKIYSNLPSVNLKETGGKIEIDIAAPGLKKQDFKVEVENNLLSISSEKEEEKEEIRINDIYYKKEFNYQSFRRSFSLADNADENKITADYKDGILHIAIDKKKSHNKESHKPSLLRKKE